MSPAEWVIFVFVILLLGYLCLGAWLTWRDRKPDRGDEE